METNRSTAANKWLEIEEDLRGMHETEADSMEDIRRYIREFPKEPDHNLAAYGNLLIYYCDVRALYTRAGYKCGKWSDAKLWETYRRQVGYIAREIAEAEA